MADESSRRKFLGKIVSGAASAATLGSIYGGIMLPPGALASAPAKKRRTPEKHSSEETIDDDEIGPIEDLMREHGLLNRLLIIYDHTSQLSRSNDKLSLEALRESVEIMRSFIEEYHEKLEEKHLFPVFEKAGKHVELVQILRTQHERGRELTELIQKSLNAGDTAAITNRLSVFVKMYRPHEAREDTVLFPAFRALLSKSQYIELGEQFEDLEHKLFGKAGFEGMVDRVAVIEKKLGLYDLAKFTAKIG